MIWFLYFLTEKTVSLHDWDFILSYWANDNDKYVYSLHIHITNIIFVGFSVFVVGVADVDYYELSKIASKPSERHVFIVDDFDAFEKIEENLLTFICETATSSK